MIMNQTVIIAAVLFAIFGVGISAITLSEYYNQQEISFPLFTTPLSIDYTVTMLLENPSLIPVESIEKNYIHLTSDKELEDKCATIQLQRLSIEKIKQYSKIHQMDLELFTINDKDLESLPQLKPLIVASHVENSPIITKTLPEPEWIYYKDWYSMNIKNILKDTVMTKFFPGFIYNDEYYELSFPSCN